MSAKPVIPDLVIGGQPLRFPNPSGVVPSWDAPGEGAPGEPWGPAATRLPKGAALEGIPLVLQPTTIDLSNPPKADVFPLTGLRKLKHR